jgi:lipoprotein-anchoring transpeptidase ErfK/SrfK
MIRILLSLLFVSISQLAAQTSGPVFTNRPVLKALPLGVEDDAAQAPASALVSPPAAPLETVSPPSPLDAKPTGDDAVRLQIFLDEANFGPGVIDGKPGRFTELAVRSWNEVNGHPIEGWIAVNTAARQAVPNPMAVAVVPEQAKTWVDPTLSTKRSLQAKKKRMSYRSYGEFMAERYHCDVPYLAELNTWQKINSLKPQDSIIVPNVKPFLIESLTGINHEADEALSARHVVVDTKVNQVRIFEAAPVALVVAEPGTEEARPVTRANRGLIASFPITPGQPKFIRFGTWELRNMVELPWWRYDQKFLDTGKRSENALNIPPGPNSPVGVIWNGTSRAGIGLHGTSDPETIGRARSAGCIRLANWDAVRLPQLIRPGATVEIR